MMTIGVNKQKVYEMIAEAGVKAGRSADEISIIAVTKYVDSELASQLVKAGVRHIGENRVDKFLDKYHSIQEEDLTWHLIGTLQRRKVKDIINFVDYFHALDSIKLAEEIQKRASRVINCFLQVNISGEVSKRGFSIDEAEAVIPLLSKLDKINIVGIMTMAPFEASQSEITAIFKQARVLNERFRKLEIKNMPFTELSMGMSRDYQEAIEQGATYVRIGTAFFK